LVRSDTGTGVSGQVIKIFDSDYDFDDLMTSGTTRSDGRFTVTWTAKTMDPTDRTTEVFAKFDGTTDLASSRDPSTYYTVTVNPAVPVTTILTLDSPPSVVSVGSTVTFTGRLKEAATDIPVGGATITIYDRDPDFDDFMASGITLSDGTFSITWVAERKDWYDDTTEVYAKFGGSTSYATSISAQFTMTVS
jgi:Flp pilus assembly protein TadG